MMTLNQVLMKFFALPPAIKMMLAVAGFGSLASIVYALIPGLGTRGGRLWVLAIAGIGLVLFLLVWAVRRMFFGKKTKALSSALDSQGPTRGDVAEQEQIYRKKFQEKMSELRANGLSVYKLPWFVLIGEPGCGKTASLIHSGLDFPLGKDEVPGFGGTRNYNWWFTNEAVILDTAGRIAFQEEGTTDRVEWEYFLKLLKRNRARCPINGIIIALPADKLLRDTSEERTQKASVLRERLRQIHQSLGVRFPTFVLVTKMDLVGGFTEFFEEVRVDLQQRNQMVGWSRAGEFQEPYDPATLPEAFDAVYRRLRDWSMRYLQRKATDDELGMVVTFPESFRQLGPALNDYIGTIFQKSPLLEPPFFRGFYFTSAVQEGAPIFDIFSRAKPGLALSERRPKAVDSKAFFIHDFYAKKVFPEHGLVFRSAKHVTLNRRMRRIVWIGSGAMVALMLTFFGFGIANTRSLIKNPQQHCAEAAQKIEKKDASFAELESNVRWAKQLSDHLATYDRPGAQFYATLLYIGANIGEPRGYVAQVHARYVSDCVLAPVLAETAARLSNLQADALADPAARERFMEALRVYATWYGEAVQQHHLSELDPQEATQRSAEFDKLLTFLDVAEPLRVDAKAQLELAIVSLARKPRSFGAQVLADQGRLQTEAGTKALLAAIEQVAASWRPRIKIDSPTANDYVKYWYQFAQKVAALRNRYGEILALKDELTQSGEPYSAAVKRYGDLVAQAELLDKPEAPPIAGSLYEAYSGLIQFLKNTPPPANKQREIIRLKAVADAMASQWGKDFAPIEKALEVGAPNREGPNVRDVYAALQSASLDLKTRVDNDLAKIRADMQIAADKEPLDELVEQGLLTAIETKPGQPIDSDPAIRVAAAALGPDAILKTYLLELKSLVADRGDIDAQLNDLRNWPKLLGGVNTRIAGVREIGRWMEEVIKGKAERKSTDEYVIEQGSRLAERRFWQPQKLYEFCDTMVNAQTKTNVSDLLKRMVAKADSTTTAADLKGIARLMPGFDGDGELPFNRHRFNGGAVAAAQPKPTEAPKPAEPPKPEPKPTDDDPLGGLGGGPTEPQKPKLSPDAKPLPEGLGEPEKPHSEQLLRKYHTRDTLIGVLRTVQDVIEAVSKVDGGQAVADALGRASAAYVQQYFSDWDALVNDPTRLLDEDTLALLQRARDGQLTWAGFVEAVGARDSKIDAECASRLQSLLRETILFRKDLSGASDKDKAVYKQILDVLRQMGGERALPIRYATALKSLESRPGVPEAEVAMQVQNAWRNYANGVKGESPTKAATLAGNIVLNQPIDVSFPLVAPLVDLAEYGETLFAYDLATKLASIFQQYAGQFPLGPSSDGNGLPPDRLGELLTKALDFKQRFGSLLSRMRGGEDAERTLIKCEDWAKFLWGSADVARLREPPVPLGVEVSVLRVPDNVAANIISVSNIYNEVTVRLPLSTQTGGIVEKSFTLYASPEAWDAGDPQKISGSLNVNAAGGAGEMTLSKPNERARDKNPPEQRRALPGGRYSVLALLSSGGSKEQAGGVWQYPVEFDVTEGDGTRRIGKFMLAFRLTEGARPFPGLIPAFTSPGAPPRMEKADQYFKVASAASGS